MSQPNNDAITAPKKGQALDHTELGPQRAWDGPLNDIMGKSYQKGISAGLGATAFAYFADRGLQTPPAQKVFPSYAKLGSQYRFYGWALFCLAVFQYNVEDSEVAGIKQRNLDAYHQSHQEEIDYIKKMEAAKQQQAKK